MMTFSYFTTKLFCALSIIFSTIVGNAFMHTIGKTLEESLKYIYMILYPANIGNQTILSSNTKMDAQINLTVQSAMVGKSTNTIKRYTKLNLVALVKLALKDLLALIITIIRIKGQ